MQTLVDHQGMVRSILAIPAGTTPALPAGGFATACLDKQARVYAFNPATRMTELVRTLTGHMAGVISLSLTSRGELITGGWEGHARVWDLASGKCLATLEGHENGTRVAGLSNGNIAVVSTGRKNEFNQHVDYKTRVWEYSAAGGTYGLLKAVVDHDQAVQDVDAIPEAGFVTASNDGTVRMRDMNGAVFETFTTPVNESEGKPWSMFKARVLPSGLVAACCEDSIVRLYSDAGEADSLPLPGTPWSIAGLPNGDIAVGGAQAATSGKGHVYIFTTDPARACSQMEAARYTQDCKPPAKRASAAPVESGGGDAMTISGPYDRRAELRGTKDGQYAFFDRGMAPPMMCSWSASAGAWIDVGEISDGPGEEDSSPGGLVSSSAGAGAGAGGKAWDYTSSVTMDTPGGTRAMQLCFNDEDDPITVARAFMVHHGIDESNYQEVRDFVIDTRTAQRPGVRARTSASAIAAGSYTHFPARVYVDFAAADLAKMASKLEENNAGLSAVGSAVALSEAEMGGIRELCAVLGDKSRYHATSVPRAAVRTLLTKLLAWPADSALPAVDLLRCTLLHPDGADEVGVQGGTTVLPALAAVMQASKSAELRPVALTVARALMNAFRTGGARVALYGSAAGQVALLEATAEAVGHEHASVRTAASAILHNFAVMLGAAAKEAAKAAAPGTTNSNPSAAVVVDGEATQQALSLVAEAVGSALGDCPTLLNLLVAVGTLVTADKAWAKYAKDMELPATVAAAVAAAPTPDSIQPVDAAGTARKAAASAVHAAAAELADVFKRA